MLGRSSLFAAGGTGRAEQKASFYLGPNESRLLTDAGALGSDLVVVLGLGSGAAPLIGSAPMPSLAGQSECQIYAMQVSSAQTAQSVTARSPGGARVYIFRGASSLVVRAQASDGSLQGFKMVDGFAPSAAYRGLLALGYGESGLNNGSNPNPSAPRPVTPAGWANIGSGSIYLAHADNYRLSQLLAPAADYTGQNIRVEWDSFASGFVYAWVLELLA